MKKTLILILLLPFCFAACEDRDSLESNPIDSNVVVLIKEVLTPDVRTFSFLCQTERPYSCLRGIETETDFNHNAFKIQFVRVPEDGFCAAQVAPASTEINLSTLKNGVYDIELTNGKLENRGTLTITESTAELKVENPHGIKISNPLLHRVPTHTYWGLIEYNTENLRDRIDDFKDKLIQLGAIFNKQTPGDYNYYEIDDNGEIVTDENGIYGKHFAERFIFQYTGDEQAFVNAVKELSKSYYDALHMRLEDYKGNIMYNHID